jgi:chromosome partitioning protein
MPVITLASVKGGVGKTSALLSLAAAFTAIGGITEANILSGIKAARAAAEYVFVDLPGVSSKLTLLGLARSDLVIVPVQALLGAGMEDAQ